MRHFAAIGSGPAGFYTAEALERAFGDKARIECLPRPRPFIAELLNFYDAVILAIGAPP